MIISFYPTKCSIYLSWSKYFLLSQIKINIHINLDIDLDLEPYEQDMPMLM